MIGFFFFFCSWSIREYNFSALAVQRDTVLFIHLFCVMMRSGTCEGKNKNHGCKPWKRKISQVKKKEDEAEEAEEERKS